MSYPQFNVGTFTGTGAGAAMVPKPGVDGLARFNVAVWGTFVATVALEQSFDAGVTWLATTFSDGTALTLTKPMVTVGTEHEREVQYRLNCTSFTSGTVNWRISQ